MGLINPEGLVLLGPGSEWFWAALSGIVTVVSLLAIWRQLRLARDGEAMKMMDGFYTEWNSERMYRYRIAVLRWLAAGRPASVQPRGALNGVGNFWEKLATLGRRGHLDTMLLWDGFGSDCVLSWYDLEGIVMQARDELGDPRIFEHFEWMVGRMVELDRRVGAQPIAQDVQTSTLQARLANLEDKLRVEVALRSPDPDIAPTASTHDEAFATA